MKRKHERSTGTPARLSSSEDRFLASAERPTNPLVCPMLTDMYQLSMAYGYWLHGRDQDYAVFDLFFRKTPFQGQYCVFAGQDEVLKLLRSFKFVQSDIDYLKTIMPTCKPEFFEWLLNVDCEGIKVYCVDEGQIVFPRQPLLRVEGPLIIAQLLETTLLNLTNFASLVATNAARMRMAAGPDKVLLEFGLRRAQGPDGGITASRYSYVGGFNGTSNVLAGKLFGMNVSGTHAHSFVMSYTGLNELKTTTIESSNPGNKNVEFLELVLAKRKLLGYENTNEGELAAFIAYAQAFPRGVVCLVDTYDTLSSGIPNFICLALALGDLGYQAKGIRLDSGDLAYLSREVRRIFTEIDGKMDKNIFAHCKIVASNDINEDVLLELRREGHEIDVFGIGTHLVTCQKQPALGCVYKLVEINGTPRIKLSQEIVKLVIPGRKCTYRLYGQDGSPLVDLMQSVSEPAPLPGQRILCRHPFEGNKRAYVTPFRVVPLLKLIFDRSVGKSPPSKLSAKVCNFSASPLPPSAAGAPSAAVGADGSVETKKQVEAKDADEETAEVLVGEQSVEIARERCMSELKKLRTDILRAVNPAPYKVSVSVELFHFMHEIWMNEAPIADLS